MSTGRVKQKHNKIGSYCFSAKHAKSRCKSIECWPGIRFICPNGATCIRADGCFSDLAPQEISLANWISTNQTSLFNRNVTCSCQDIAKKQIAGLVINNNALILLITVAANYFSFTSRFIINFICTCDFSSDFELMITCICIILIQMSLKQILLLSVKCFFVTLTFIFDNE